MARFVSRYQKPSFGIRDEISEQYATGGSRVLTRGLEAQFEPKGLTDYEIEQGTKLLPHAGLPQDRDTGADVDPRSRLSLFDSRAAQKQYRWTDEEHDLVVKELRESHLHGNAYIEVETLKRPAPWGGYDKIDDVDKLLEMIEATETSYADALAYELENQARPAVIDTLEALLGETESDELVVDA